MIATIFIVLCTISGLMILHELGHFILAKKFGVRVDEFGVGYPPRLFSKKIGQTLYSLNLIPLGAFVKIKEKDIEDFQAFAGKPIWQRTLILLGGIVSFWIIAAVLLSIAFGMGTFQAISDEAEGILTPPRVRITSVAPGSPAKAAGLRTMDIIKKLRVKDASFYNDNLNKKEIEVDKVIEVQEFVKNHKAEEIVLTIGRGKEEIEVSLIPRATPPKGEGAMGVALVRTTVVRYPWWQAPFKGIEATFNTTWFVIISLFQAISNAIQGLPTGVQLTGPVGVGVLIGQATQEGMSYFLQFVALISVHLAIFNLLPIPAVDGGRLAFLGIEKIKGRAIDQKLEQKINTISLALLFSLMIWVTVKDIMSLF